MILELEQINRELYEANFRIRRGDDMAGAVHVQGRPGQMDAEVQVSVLGAGFFLSREGNPAAPAQTKRRQDKKETAYHTYLIDGGRLGSICQVERKTGMFSTAGYHELLLENDVFQMYSKSFKTEGKSSIYCGDRQIAQVDTSAEIVDDMHHYRIYAAYVRGAEAALLFSVYQYILTGFKPGQKMTKGYHKQVSISFDRTFDDRYDPGFAGRIEP